MFIKKIWPNIEIAICSIYWSIMCTGLTGMAVMLNS